jgi:hypothetical protein
MIRETDNVDLLLLLLVVQSSETAAATTVAAATGRLIRFPTVPVGLGTV